MRLVDYLDKGASLGPDAPVPHHGRADPARYARGAGDLAAWWPTPWGDAGSRRGSRWRSSRPTTRRRSPACSGSRAPARCGARSTRATRRPRTASCSTSSTAPPCCSRRRSRRWSRRSRDDLPKLTLLVCLDGEMPGALTLESVPRRTGAELTRPTRPNPVAESGVADLAMIVGHRRHHRPAQGRDADRPQPRDDDGADADGVPVRAAGRRTSRSRPSPTPPACCASRSWRWAARS